LKNIEYKSILVVDDDTGIRDALEEYLTGKGYEIRTAPDGESAIELASLNKIYVVLLDINLPGIDGIETLKGLRGIDSDIIVILMTGYASLDTSIEAVKEGAYEYITKPFKLDQILVSVKNAFEKVYLRERHKIFVDELRKSGGGGGGGSGGSGAGDGPGGGVATAGTAEESIISILERLASLRDRKMLSTEEYELIKKRYIMKE
ncbi:MAG: response regulator, partial [Thermodesulfobacteriota bacterium]